MGRGYDQKVPLVCSTMDVDNQIANLSPQAAPIEVDRPSVIVPPQDTPVDIDQPIEDSVVQHPEPAATKSGRNQCGIRTITSKFGFKKPV